MSDDFGPLPQPVDSGSGPSPLGFGPQVDVYAGQNPQLQPGDEIAGGLAGVVGSPTPPIYTEDALAAVAALDEPAQKLLAMEMFMFGGYRDIEDVFLDDGGLNPEQFDWALRTMLSNAEALAEISWQARGENSEYLRVLLGDTDRSKEEIEAEFAKRLAAARGGGGGGRVINYIDPVALAAAAKDAFSSVTGRRATPTEQRDFVKQIHGLQASGATGIQVGPRAEAFAQSSAPVEAGAMDYARGAGLLMQAMGL